MEIERPKVERPTCATCPYWEPLPAGRCRRAAPVVTNSAFEVGVWPETRAGDWCGEHPDFPAYLAGLKAEPRPAAPLDTSRRAAP